MFILGITGPTGAGKSLVCERLKALGFSHIDADKTARVVVEKGKPCLLSLKKTFGDEIINPDGTLNRKKLATLAFACGRVDELNSTILPYIIEEINNTLNIFRKNGVEYVALDAPTLFESGADKLCSKILVVTAKKETRLQRICERDNLSKAKALERINAQHNDDFYLKRSDYVIKNDGDNDSVLSSVDSLFKKIAEEERLVHQGGQ